MKTLQDRMTEMKPYVRGVEMYNEALIVKVVYPSKWQAYPSKDGKIKVTPSETNPNESFYYADSEDTTYDDMLDLIAETIKVNSETALKIKLLAEKIEELKEIFSNKDYDELLSLTFSFEKPKRKYAKSKKTAQNANKVATEESIQEDNEPSVVDAEIVSVANVE